MASITRHLSKHIDQNGRSQILLRVNINHTTQIRLKSHIFISPNNFSQGHITTPHHAAQAYHHTKNAARQLAAIEQAIIDHCEQNHGTQITKQQLTNLILHIIHPDQQPRPTPTTSQAPTLQQIITQYTLNTPLSPSRKTSYQTLQRTLDRYCAYRTLTNHQPHTLPINTITHHTLADIETFLRTEHQIATTYPTLYPNTKHPTPRSINTIAAAFNLLRAIIRQAHAKGLIPTNPFNQYTPAATEQYGTPYYLTIDERNHIQDHDLHDHPTLTTDRDRFIFQCLTGCRVSDLLNLTQANITDNTIEYIPHKTITTNPSTVRVPLHPRAQAIIQRYRHPDPTAPLFPPTTPRRYNQNIRHILRLCHIDRPVTTLDTHTLADKMQPIHTIATSHLARRTFIGNLYNRLQDPAIISKLSGHVEGSKSFARYRRIDDDITRRAILLLDH